MRTLIYFALGIAAATFLCLFIIAAIKDSKKVIRDLNDLSNSHKHKKPAHHQKAA